MSETCGNCGATAPDDARFCMDCGRPVITAATSGHAQQAQVAAIPTPLAEKMRAAPVTGERKPVTAVFVDVEIFAGIVAAERGDLDEALKRTRVGVQLADEVGNTYCSLVGNFFLGDQYLRRGEAESAVASLTRSRELAEFCDAGSLMSLSDAWLGAANARLVEAGDLRVFDAPLRHARVIGDRYGESLVLQLRSRARASQPDPDWASSIDDLQSAAKHLEDLGARPALTRVLRDLGRALSEAGRGEAAADVLRRADELTRTMGMSPDPTMKA